MHAARLHAYGDIDQFSYDEIATPEAGPGEVLIKVEASSLNGVEPYLRQGYLAQMFAAGLPAILGLDVAGTIAQVSDDVTDFVVGDRVFGKLAINGKGSNAEYVATTPGRLPKLPDTLGFAEAATLPLAALTGRQAVNGLAIKGGERVLVTGALGAVGRAAVHYLKQLGAVPVAGVRAARLAEAKALGIDAVAIETASGANFDAAVDSVGGPMALAANALVRDGGVLAAVAGVPDGANADGRIRIVNVSGVDDKAMLLDIAAAAARGELKIPVAKTLKFSEVAEGHRLLGAGQVGGKIIFVP